MRGNEGSAPSFALTASLLANRGPRSKQRPY
jgi:hypothetical protein